MHESESSILEYFIQIDGLGENKSEAAERCQELKLYKEWPSFDKLDSFTAVVLYGYILYNANAIHLCI